MSIEQTCSDIRLTQYSHGAGCGCKISPKVLDLDGVVGYIEQGAVPGGSHRNFDSYGDKVSALTDIQKTILCDPQTSGGLLISVKESMAEKLLETAQQEGVSLQQIGRMHTPVAEQSLISVL